MIATNPKIHPSINPSAATVRLFASARSWIEGEALRQFYAMAKLEGMRSVVGFPDLHPGNGGPVGAAFVTEDIIYPFLTGGDIGCGMGLFKTDLSPRSAERVSGWADLRFDLEHPWEGDVRAILAVSELESTEFNEAFGTLGGGNHFAELQRVEEVLNGRELKRLGLNRQQLVVLAHSGSRGLGESILHGYAEDYQANGSDAESFVAAAYLREHDQAVRWAKASRALLARRFVEAMGAEAECLWDGCHNSISRQECEGEAVWVHRKGAVAADGGPVMIPGSCGSLSYLVKPIGDAERNAWSLAHGAGRKWSRSETRWRMRERFDIPQLTQTPLGGRVICEQRELLYEEAPTAYKNIEAVIQDLLGAGLITVVATFRPLLTYKTRKVRG